MFYFVLFYSVQLLDVKIQTIFIDRELSQYVISIQLSLSDIITEIAVNVYNFKLLSNLYFQHRGLKLLQCLISLHA